MKLLLKKNRERELVNLIFSTIVLTNKETYIK